MPEITAEIIMTITVTIPITSDTSHQIIDLWRDWKGPEPMLVDMTPERLVFTVKPLEMLPVMNYLKAQGITTVLK
jgi:hypothetical protein